MRGMGGMNNIMQQAMKMQKKMQELQEKAAEQEVEASAGGGMVKVTVNGKQELVNITIEKSVVEDGDVEMLQDLVVAAVNKGIEDSQNMMKEEMSKLTGGMNIPNIPGMF